MTDTYDTYDICIIEMRHNPYVTHILYVNAYIQYILHIDTDRFYQRKDVIDIGGVEAKTLTLAIIYSVLYAHRYYII